jgi:hypothetical protein
MFGDLHSNAPLHRASAAVDSALAGNVRGGGPSDSLTGRTLWPMAYAGNEPSRHALPSQLMAARYPQVEPSRMGYMNPAANPRAGRRTALASPLVRKEVCGRIDLDIAGKPNTQERNR